MAERQSDDERLEAFRAAVRKTAGSFPDLPPGNEYVDAIRGRDTERLQELWGDHT